MKAKNKGEEHRGEKIQSLKKVEKLLTLKIRSHKEKARRKQSVERVEVEHKALEQVAIN